MPWDAMGVYVHVPYCRVVCPYCDFVKKRTGGPAPEAFVDALCREIEAFDGPREAKSIFFGGGTPSLLEEASLGRILECIHGRFDFDDPEVGLEANPDDVCDGLASAWQRLGVNRVILGVQAFDDKVLRYLGRIHDADAGRRACACVAERFGNWGLDLIFGAPPVSAWEATLTECLALEPRHVSAYSLTFEARTPFWKRREEAVDPDRSLDLYRRAIRRLGEGGFEHYEISNFARMGYQSRHNLIYWRNGEYAGFGPGAYSYLGGVRSRNLERTEAYLDEPGRKMEALRLTDEEIRVETLIQYFRTRAGLDRASYRRRFGRPVEEDFGEVLGELMARGLLEEDGLAVFPTPKGFELNDEIGLALVSGGLGDAVVAQGN